MNNEIFFFFFFVLIISSKTFAQECDFDIFKNLNELHEIRNLNSINIKIDNYRKFQLNNLKIISSKNININKKFKKNFTADIYVDYKFGKCKVKGKVRQLGDGRDHIKFLNGMVLQSLDITLLKGNILGITKFKLFLPETRNNEDEIIGSTILSNLSFISPRSKKLLVNINGIANNMIFQESSAKELLETNSYNEGLIFEGDESLLWNPKFKDPFLGEKISTIRVLNSNYLLRNKINLKKSIDVMTVFQKLYINSLGKELKNVLDYGSVYEYNNTNFKNLKIYDLIILSMNGHHSLRPHNRKFFYDLVTEEIHPIYYDGDLHVSQKFINLNQLDYLYLKKNINDTHFKEAQMLVKNINEEVLLKELVNRGLKISIEDIKIIKKNISKNLSIIKNNLKISKKFNGINISNYVDSWQDKFYKLYPNGKIVTLLSSIDNDNKLLFKFCDINKCNNKLLNLEDSKKIFENKYQKFNVFSYSSKHHSEKYFTEFNTSKDIKLKIEHSKNVTIKFSNENEINIIFENSKEWALISDQIIHDININLLINQNLNESLNYKNKRGLTGCLTFYNIKFNNSNLKSENSKCEDSINIIKSQGKINNISISDSISDGLDIDFSHLTIDNISINNSTGDCIDLSYGNYLINRVFVNECVDKGISIGEKSNTKLGKLEVKNSNIGIAVKDSSIVKINSFKNKNNNNCLSIYNKKQEFYGGILDINEIFCDDKKYKIDKFSKLVIN